MDEYLATTSEHYSEYDNPRQTKPTRVLPSILEAYNEDDKSDTADRPLKRALEAYRRGTPSDNTDLVTYNSYSLNWNHRQAGTFNNSAAARAGIGAVVAKILNTSPHDISQDNLVQVLAALPKESSIRTKLMELVAEKLPKQSDNINEKITFQETAYKASAKEADAAKKTIRENGATVANAIREEKFTSEQIAETAADWWLRTLPRKVSFSAPEAFKAAVKKHILGELQQGRGVTLSTDSQHEGVLADLIKAHGYSLSRLGAPHKTSMHIQPVQHRRAIVITEGSRRNLHTLPLSNEYFGPSHKEQDLYRQLRRITEGLFPKHTN